jgi:hypothetical protein
MPLKVRTTSQSLSDDAKQAFVSYSRFVFSVYSSLRRRRRIPSYSLEVLLTDDFVTEVRRWSESADPVGGAAELDFTPERVGGVVAAKTLPLEGDYSRAVVIFDSSLWPEQSDPVALSLVAHEQAHVLFGRASHASGALQGVVFPPITGREMACHLSRILAEEYRADRLADIVVRLVTTATVDGETRKIGCWEVASESYLGDLQRTLRQAHPAWPDTVQAYRERRSDLLTMWNATAKSISETLTLLVHAQALADGTDVSNLLDTEPLASLPAVGLYLAGSWPRLLDTIRATPVLPTMTRYKPCEEEIVHVGESVILEILGCLGLDVDEHPNRKWALWVREPKR